MTYVCKMGDKVFRVVGPMDLKDREGWTVFLDFTDKRCVDTDIMDPFVKGEVSFEKKEDAEHIAKILTGFFSLCDQTSRKIDAQVGVTI